MSVADVGENISVSVTADDVKLGVLFTISGYMDPQKIDEMDVSWDLGMMSMASPQMTSSGLFVANLIAQKHRAECSIEAGNLDITKIMFFVRQ